MEQDQLNNFKANYASKASFDGWSVKKETCIAYSNANSYLVSRYGVGCQLVYGARLTISVEMANSVSF